MSYDDSMLDIYFFENQKLLEKLENLMLCGEKGSVLSSSDIDEVFRIMHTIKGASSMMSFDNLFHVTHSVEDLFSLIRENGGDCPDWSDIFDIVLETIDFVKNEFAKIQNGQANDGDPQWLIDKIEEHLKFMNRKEEAPRTSCAPRTSEEPAPCTSDTDALQHPCYKIKLAFEPDCKMEHIRAVGIANALNKLCSKIMHIPENLDAETACSDIAENGFTAFVRTMENPDSIKQLINEELFIKSFSVIPIDNDNEELPESMRAPKLPAAAKSSARSEASQSSPEIITKQNFISVNVNKLDSLMDLVGELVTTESMVTRSPDLAGLHLNNFETAARQLQSLTSELQGIVMSIRMLPVSTIFFKMQRIARDTSKKVKKNINLVLVGEETEVDKNIIDSLSDPLMHLIRNAIDHGIESPEERIKKGKPEQGQIKLEAKNTGEDVMIVVSDDGKGLDYKQIIKKAKEKGLITKSGSEISEKEAFSYIFMPGFSTKSEVTEFSGRGVGMDVVRKGIEKLGGTISVDSAVDEGTTISIRIPLTLAIVDGMQLTVGPLIFIAPMISIRESFVPDIKNVFYDPDGNERIMIRGECYSIVRLHNFFGIEDAKKEMAEGILIMIDSDINTFCILVDKIIGEQQVVVKPLPEYIQKKAANLNGLSGCTILGDGKISLILNVNNLRSASA